MINIKPVQKTALDETIEDAIRELKGHDAHTDEYRNIVNQLTALYAIKAEERPDRIKRDTLVLAGANLLGIVMIVGHERAHIVTSKALSLIRQMK